jgi:hypothetical protein
LQDLTAGQVEWQLSMKDMSDTEIGALSSLFEAAQGQFGSFLFIDPMANLLGWSEDLLRPDWQVGLLNITPGIADPAGTLRASSVANTSAGSQTIQQTLTVPGEYVACFSAWVSSSVAGQISIMRDGLVATSTVGPAWKRVHVSGRGASGASQATFSVVLSAGQSIDIWGLQVEAQPSPSEYKSTRTALGIYEETYFASDELKITRTGVGLSSCEIVLQSRT